MLGLAPGFAHAGGDVTHLRPVDHLLGRFERGVMLQQAQRRHVPGAGIDRGLYGERDAAFVDKIEDAAAEEADFASLECGRIRHEKLDIPVKVVDRTLACLERTGESDGGRYMPGEVDADLKIGRASCRES